MCNHPHDVFIIKAHRKYADDVLQTHFDGRKYSDTFQPYSQKQSKTADFTDTNLRKVSKKFQRK